MALSVQLSATGCKLCREQPPGPLASRFVKRLLLALAVMTAGCSGGTPATSSTTTLPPTPLTTTTTTTTVATVDACDPPVFLPTVLPARVADQQPPTSSVPLDQFTTLPGTTIRFWADADGSPVMVLVRGALPPVRWTAAPEHVPVRGADAAMGPLGDGVWAVAWFEGPDRCDEYSLIFYPPADPDEVRAVAEGLTGG